MKPAIWSKVASALKTKFGISWDAAKTAYQKLRQTADRTPSLRMVKTLPERLPRALKETPKPTRAAKPAKPRETQAAPKPRSPTLKFPPGISPAPPMKERPKAKPRRVPWNQSKTKNYFEEQLLKLGLPVRAIASSTVGQEIVSDAEGKAIQRRIAQALAAGYREIKKNGGMSKETKDRVSDLMVELFGESEANAAWHGILANLYGATPKPKTNLLGE